MMRFRLPSRLFERQALRLFLVMLFLAGQALGIFHLVEHAIEGGEDHCEICMMAAHSGHATLPDIPSLSPPKACESLYSQAPRPLGPASAFDGYASRAPPVR
jgi:hypothetical protein